jgi:RNA polymerase sigma-70 factor, ECF subfamily
MMERRTVAGWYVTEGSDDASLVTAARDGDRDAFGRLYSRYSRMVHGILLARVGSADVDDLVQDAFVHAFRRLHDLNDATRFGGWLAAIARSRANDHRRRLQTASAVRQALAMEEGSMSPMNPSLQMSAERILELIRALPDAYRETLILRLIEGMTGPEIAVRTGLTPGSVRVNLYRGMQQLREKMSQKIDASELEAAAAPGKGLVARLKRALGKRNAR